ncbi:hypothetical protein J1605_014980 [Eschrichtius robustus]|uniref:Uncharacterized protein n=1 Tax=Eschrichtius robustus TaxID=9764 RepID=A0AB34GCZ7_ESCRO|nr:hypothetical protein J1605_014980 [Eschrichtius robustus]
MPKLPRRPWKMVKLMETKLIWTGPSLRVKVALEAKVVAEVAKVDLVAEAGEALEGEEASKEAEEEEETTSHKERSFFYPCLSLFQLKEKTLGCLLCYLLSDRAF